MSDIPPPPENRANPSTGSSPRARWGKLPEIHVLVCTNERPPGNPKGSCAERGSVAVFDALKLEAARQGVMGRVLVNRTNCLKPCAYGPTVTVYPRGYWYGAVRPEDAQELLTCALANQTFEDRARPPEAHDWF